MENEIVRGILEAESRADEIRKNSNLEAKATIAAAKADCDSRRVRAVDEATKSYRQAISRAEREGEIQSDALIQAGEKQAMSLVEVASKKNKIATEYIVSGVVSGKWL